jgi:threonine aldolase
VSSVSEAHPVDLRSDTKTRPTDAMRRYMCVAPVGDEQKGEDPTVLVLEERVAGMTGKDAAVFLPSGTMCNIIALFLHCRPGDEVLTHRHSHVAYAEMNGPAVHARVTLLLLDGERGILEPSNVMAGLDRTRRGASGARASLLSLENTHNVSGGAIWPLRLQQEVCAVARDAGLATHLDGARLLNASVAAGIPVIDYCTSFDSAWIDLSKGLGCPVGAVLVGTAAFIDDARRAKRLFGGAMRQAGILAAAGIYALEHHVARLADDHDRARRLGEALAALDSVVVEGRPIETNIVHFDISASGVEPAEFLARTQALGVRFGLVGGSTIRAVTHLDIADEDLPTAVSAVRAGVSDPA